MLKLATGIRILDFLFRETLLREELHTNQRGKKYTSDTLVKWENETNMFKNNKTYKQLTALEKIITRNKSIH